MTNPDRLTARPAARFLDGIGSAGPALLLVGVLLVAVVWGHRGNEPGALHLPSVPAGGPMRAVLVLHPDDCPTNWRFLELLGSPVIGRRVAVVRIAPPTAEGVGLLQRRLPESLQEIAIRHLGAPEREALGRLGYRFGPLLLLFDHRARLRAIEPAPSTPKEFVELGRRLRLGPPLEVVPN